MLVYQEELLELIYVHSAIKELNTHVEQSLLVDIAGHDDKWLR